MAYVKVEDGVVVQKQPNDAAGFQPADDSVVCGMLYVDNKFVAPEPDPKSEEELKREAKLAGVEFEGVMCSATAEDMWGLAAIKHWIEDGNSVPYQFDNGNTLLITPENYLTFRSTWEPFRASFFQQG